MSHPSFNQPSSLEGWLQYLESIHPSTIDMGLARTQEVFARLKLDFSQMTVITVAGTNGKGTTCTFLEQAFTQLGHSTCVYSSPHILDYRERLRCDTQMLSEDAHCQAFARVEQARGEISLTYFEFGTLAALVLIAERQPDFAILEVGLGGRLDAVNILDADIGVITTIDLDHQDWLGDTRELVAAEKAGIFRQNGVAVIGDAQPPANLPEIAGKLNLDASWQGSEFSYRLEDGRFYWQSHSGASLCGPRPAIPAANVSTALCVLERLGKLPSLDVERLLSEVKVVGRCQLVGEHPSVLVDVAHNPQSAGYLLEQVQRFSATQVHLVVGMLKDKDIRACLLPFTALSPNWYLAPLGGPRGASSKMLADLLPKGQKVLECQSVKHAYQQALQNAQAEDLVVVFGSFFTVAEVLEPSVQ
ncbi:bifunctional tetrahydrofolate synthase/dihydrofolate synthase [Bowmanella sp. Y26]|uniref:bifunctional tetrahydrofolate synthase/dihydrofolate synthase n=1 Tax=Bowmanella yangjiangensis TaxID=2811230 RepID=UPI001BDC4FAE|nr:bifunctional tetrahydrofolate synthase/dihydrofolate synthase [Bowmanella yangjiangensis]MBT1062982.1 bifunctional tetrahydrofolate synthase/dihydrofolate synthase [Bowmanella yangjiangensis]